MKKAMALLIALAAVLSLTGTAFAADMGESGITSTMEFAPGSTDANPLLNVSQNQLVLSLGASNQLVLPETHLTPGTEYEYRIYRVKNNTTQPLSPSQVDLELLTGNDLNDGTLRVRSAKGSGVMSSVSLKKRGSGSNATYNLVVETRTNYGTKMTDVEYTLVVSGQTAAPNDLIPNSTVSFEVGYRTMDDDVIDDYSEGDIVTIEQDYPVITRSQFNTLARNFNYKAIEFVDDSGEWSYTGRVSGMSDTNFVTSYDVIEPIVNKLPDQDYKFLTFNAGVTFPTNGEMRIDVSDISGNYDRLYAYLYRNGSLTPISYSYDSGADEIVFRTNYLGAFVMTDTEITDTSILDDEENNTDNEGNNNGGNTSNPDTGARNTAGAVAMGVVALAAAGVVVRKRK